MKTVRVTECKGSTALRNLLKKHPGVILEAWQPSDRYAIHFVEEKQERILERGRFADDGTYGLLELMDNNPLVCAQHASVPGALATLGLICLGPLARAEMLASQPTIEPSFEENPAELEAALRLEGFAGGVRLIPSTGAPQGLISVRCVAPVRNRLAAELEELYEELYGRSFFLRPASVLKDETIVGTPFGTYALDARRLESEGALEVRATADAEGKCGAAQMVHMFNVMAGFEEDLGLSRLVNMEQTL